MRKNILAGAAALALSTSAAVAGGHTGQITATLTIEGECEVLVQDIAAETENFSQGDVTLVHDGTLTLAEFDAFPTGSDPISNEATIAILCSASDADHTLSLVSGGAVLEDDTEPSPLTIPWTPFVEDLDNGTPVEILTSGTDVELTADEEAATLHEFTVTAEVTSQDIADAIPGTYEQTIEVTVSFAVPPNGP